MGLYYNLAPELCPDVQNVQAMPGEMAPLSCRCVICNKCKCTARAFRPCDAYYAKVRAPGQPAQQRPQMYVSALSAPLSLPISLHVLLSGV